MSKNVFFKELTALIEYTKVRKSKKDAYGENAASGLPSQIHGLKIVPKLEDFVKQWNKMRNDNVVTKQAEVIEMPPDPPEEPSPLDEGVPAL